MGGWASLALALAVVAALAVLWTTLQGRRTSRARGASPAAFLRHFDALGIPDDIALSIYHHLERWMADSRGSIAIGPRDDLRAYGIDPEDLADALALLLASCGRRAGTDAARPRIASVEDLVRYVASCPPLPRDSALRGPTIDARQPQPRGR